MTGRRQRRPRKNPRQQAGWAASLEERFPPSEPCCCDVCIAYCSRPGWWTVDQVERAIAAGYAPRMMLEMAPEKTFGVLSPALRGCEGQFADYARQERGCTFFSHGLCELFGTGFQPLECRYCHHSRKGAGMECHHAIENDWNSPAGVALVVRWSKMTGFWERVVAPKV